MPMSARSLGNGRVWGRALTWIKFFQLLYRGSKANAGAQLQEVPLEIDEIERARASGDRTPDLHVPRRRDKISFAEGRVEGRADIERLPCEIVEAEPLVVTKAARFRAHKDVRHHLHRERRADPERRFAQGLAGPAQPRLRRLVADIERREQTAGYQFAVGKHAKIGAVLVARRPAHLVRKTPTGLDAQRQPERRVLALEQTVSRVERDGLQRPLAAIVDPVHPRDVVIGDRRHGGETEPVGETVFGLERRRDVVVGAAGLAETAGRIGFEFLFSRFPGVAAFREAEHMLGIDLAVPMFASVGRRGTGYSEPGQQNQYRP